MTSTTTAEPHCSRQPLARILAAALIGWLAAATGATAQSFHSEDHGYSLDVPEGWTQIPDEIVQKPGAQPGSGNGIDAGFQKEGPGFSPAYFMIHVAPYSLVGLDRQLHEDEFEAAVGALSAGLQHLGSGGSAAGTRPKLDREGRRFSWILRVTAGNRGQVRGEIHGYFGRHALVQVMFFVRQSEWAVYQAQRRLIFDSFQFDPDHAYDESQGAPVGEEAPADAVAGASEASSEG